MLAPTNYTFLCQLVHERSGLVLLGDKQYLIESRLIPVARRNGLGTIDDLCSAARNPGAEAIRVDITEAMTTNETFFFRDKTPFDHFSEQMIRHLLKARSNLRRIRVWCAAASTGQEPFSIAMMVQEMSAQMAGWRVEILATDISNEVLEKAKLGMYTQFEVQRGLPINYLVKYFKQIGDMWQIDPAIRAMVQFRPLNLLRDFRDTGTFDIVFCRNVLIYFDQPTKTDVLNRLSEAIAQDGFLVLGASETTIGLTDKLKTVDGMRTLHTLATAQGGQTRALRA